MVNLIEFKRLRATAKRTIIDSKRQTWQQFTKTLTTSTTPSKFGGKLKLLKIFQHTKTLKFYKPTHKILQNQLT